MMEPSDNLHAPPPSLRRHQTGADPHGALVPLIPLIPHSDEPPPPTFLGRQVTIHLEDDAAATTTSLTGSDELSVPASSPLTRQITINQVDPEGNKSTLVGHNQESSKTSNISHEKEQEAPADEDDLPPPTVGLAFVRQSTQVVENETASAADKEAASDELPPIVGLAFTRQSTQIEDGSADKASDDLPDDLPPVVGLAFTRQSTQVVDNETGEPAKAEDNGEDDLPPPSLGIAFTRQSTQVVEDENENSQTEAAEKEAAESDDLPPPALGIAFVRQSTQVVEEIEKNEREAKEAAEKEAAEKEAADQDELPPLSGIAFVRQSTQVVEEEQNDKETDTPPTVVATVVKPIAKVEAVKVIEADSLTIPEINPVFSRVPTDTNPHGGDCRASPRLFPISPPRMTLSPLSSPARFSPASSISSFPSPSTLTSSVSTDSTASFFMGDPEFDLFRFDSS